MSPEIINLLLMAGSAILGYFLRSRFPQPAPAPSPIPVPGPGPIPGPAPSPLPGPVNPLYDLLRLLLESLLRPRPGVSLGLAPQYSETAPQFGAGAAEQTPPWAAELLAELRTARRQQPG